MATYDGERYLRNQLLSLQQQTYEDWTVWVRDDGSTDETTFILRKLAESDSRILRKEAFILASPPSIRLRTRPARRLKGRSGERSSLSVGPRRLSGPKSASNAINIHNPAQIRTMRSILSRLTAAAAPPNRDSRAGYQRATNWLARS